MEESHVITFEDHEVGDDNLTSEAIGPQAIIPFIGAPPPPLLKLI